MGARDDGGSAFPSHGSMGEVEHRGMSLRDWFAGQALAGYFANAHTPHQNAASSETAEYAYRTADFMLAERQKKDS